MSSKSALQSDEWNIVVDIGDAIETYKAAIREVSRGTDIDDFMSLFGKTEDYVEEVVAELCGLENHNQYLSALSRYPQLLPIRNKAYMGFLAAIGEVFEASPDLKKLRFTSFEVMGHLALLRGIAMEQNHETCRW